MTQSIYIAGPMRGHKRHNFDAFYEAEKSLEAKGWLTLNPARMDEEGGFDPDRDEATPEFLAAARKRDIDAIITANAMCMLPGWRKSVGATAEYHMAIWLGIPVYQYPDLSRLDVDTKRVLPTDAEQRKRIPLYRGLFQYFPRALAAVAHLSWCGNEQHNPGTPLHWDRSKSGDEVDALLRHVMDGDWTEVAWRALAKLEKELE